MLHIQHQIAAVIDAEVAASWAMSEAVSQQALHTDRELSASEKLHSGPTKQVKEGEGVNEPSSPCRVMSLLEKLPSTYTLWSYGKYRQEPVMSKGHLELTVKNNWQPPVHQACCPGPALTAMDVNKLMCSLLVGSFQVFVELSSGTRAKRSSHVCDTPLTCTDVSDFLIRWIIKLISGFFS